MLLYTLEICTCTQDLCNGGPAVFPQAPVQAPAPVVPVQPVQPPSLAVSKSRGAESGQGADRGLKFQPVDCNVTNAISDSRIRWLAGIRRLRTVIRCCLDWQLCAGEECRILLMVGGVSLQPISSGHG